MVFSNFLFAVALTVVWPLGMLGLLAACAWLERRTLVAEEVVPRRLRRMESKPPEAVEAMVHEETSEVVADYWSTPNHPYMGAKPSPNGRRPEPAAKPTPPAAEEPQPLRAIWPKDAAEPATAAPSEAAARAEPQAGADSGPDASRVVPSRVERLARRWPAKGRHERR
ncbi:MAG TPA: hypothetical protein VF486_00475 [Actinomycetes bacterium]